MNSTPKANRLHIGIFGKRNAGKSSLINALTGQRAALVSGVPGTTTDPVYQAMELPGIGPCVFMDTAGFDDEGEVGAMRVQQTRRIVDQSDVALFVCTGPLCREETEWLRMLEEKKIPTVLVVNKSDLLENPAETAAQIGQQCGYDPVIASARCGRGAEHMLRTLTRLLPPDYDEPQIVGTLAGEGDGVLLVMPQDSQAPKGRLILPQVQTIRELLDKQCTVICCTPGQLDETMRKLAAPPELIITDSQAFASVYQRKPAASRLTSFSVLFARRKGDIGYYAASAEAIGRLDESSRVLIAEACTHAPRSEDIGRVKLPALLRKRVGAGLQIEVVSGSDFPEDLSSYSLIIHCGACMFNRRHVLSRIESARSQGVPMTNYGVAIAYLNGILDKIVY